MTYIELVERILSVAGSHEFVHETYYGDVYEFENSGSRKYVNSVLTITNSVDNGDTTSYTFSLFATERLLDDKSNKVAAQSLCKSILTSILDKLCESGDISLGSATYYYWTEKFNDLCAGSYVTFSVSLPREEVCTDDTIPTIVKTIKVNGIYDVSNVDEVEVKVATAVRPKFVTFWDFMGNILAAYEEEEVATINFPTPLDYSALGLRHYGWSETLEDIRTTKRALDVVCRYESDTEKIFIDITMDDTEFYLGYTSKFDDPYIVNWGDDSAIESIEQSATHLYKKGSYVIEVIPPAQAAGINNHTQVLPTECVSGYIADKNKAYTNGCPLWHKIGSYTSYSFYYIRWLVHSYRYIIKRADNVYYGTYYRSVVVNDLKGRQYQGNSVFNGKVMTAMEENPGVSAIDLRVVYLAFDSYGQKRITSAGNCYNAEYVYFPDGALQRGDVRFTNFNKIRKIEGIPEIEIKGRMNMNQMFYNCTSLMTLDVSNWDTSSATNMNQMFSGCTSLMTLDVSKWDTSSVTNMNQMFYNCASLMTLDVSKWDTSSVTNMNYMFNSCTCLMTLDMTGLFDCGACTTRSNFYGTNDSIKSVIGSHTLAEVESGEIVACKNMGKNTFADLSKLSIVRYSSILAVVNGTYDRKAAGLANQTFYIGRVSFNNMRNDNDTIPDSATITERQNKVLATLTSKGYNIAYQ